jgi:NitT/TauT family transport system permease protein
MIETMTQSETPAPQDAVTNPAAQRLLRAQRREAAGRIVLPLAIVALLLLGWEALVRVNGIPHYILPAPSLVLQTLVKNWSNLAPSLWFTVKLTLMALAVAVAGGVLIAMAFALSKWVEIALFPIAVVLQVTPIVAIAPLILIYVDSTTSALLICAWIVAFFPILSNTVIGLKSADTNLRDLYQLYGATPWQRFRWLLVPSALPYFLGGLKIAGGLSLIGAVVAEFTAGAAGRETGLASRILESSFRTEIPMMFAALLLVSLLGIVIFIAFAALAKLLLGHWHESELRREV